MSERAALTIAAPPGRCVACGCTDSHACIDAQIGASCYWVIDSENFCSWCAIRYWIWIASGEAYANDSGLILPS